MGLGRTNKKAALKRSRLIMAMIEIGRSATTEELAEATGFTRQFVCNTLNGLRQIGKIGVAGEERKVTYGKVIYVKRWIPLVTPETVNDIVVDNRRDRISRDSDETKFAKLIGAHRYDDVEIRPAGFFRHRPDHAQSLVGCGTAMCSG